MDRSLPWGNPPGNASTHLGSGEPGKALILSSAAEVPPPDEIERLIPPGRGKLRIGFEPALSEDAATALDVSRLKEALPDLYLFGDSRGITFLRVISRQEVLANADIIVAAAGEFRRTAEDLILKVARKLNVETRAFEDPFHRLWRQRPPQSWRRFVRDQIMKLLPDHGWMPNRLPGGWDWGFHGCSCDFLNLRTGQRLDVCLGYPGEFGVLDPYYFTVFCRTTLGLESVAPLFVDPFYDAHRALELLADSGRLTRIHRNPPLTHQEGICAPPSVAASV